MASPAGRSGGPKGWSRWLDPAYDRASRGATPGDDEPRISRGLLKVVLIGVLAAAGLFAYVLGTMALASVIPDPERNLSRILGWTYIALAVVGLVRWRRRPDQWALSATFLVLGAFWLLRAD